MRVATLFSQTWREDPTDASRESQRLALRAGLVRPIAQGVYAFLPLGWQVVRRIEAILRKEMEAIGAQEIFLPLVQPAELWQALEGCHVASSEAALVRFQDRTGHPMVLGAPHEGVVTDLARQLIRSYRQLPCLVYQIQIQFRDEPRARGGPLPTREFLMKEAYSFDAAPEAMAYTYERVYQAYQRIFIHCGVDALPVRATTGVMEGGISHKFMALNEGGEDVLIRCCTCGYAADIEEARIGLGPHEGGAPQPLEKVATPGKRTIREVAAYLGVAPARTLKAVFCEREDTGDVVFAVIRGDLEVNKAKLSRALGGVGLKSAREDSLQTMGLVPGYASPVGIRGIMVVADASVLYGSNWVAGANEEGYHLRNVNVPRDFQPDLVADIALAREGDPCPDCGAPLQCARAIEVGHTLQLGSKYSEALGATYLDAHGQAQPLWMGRYGIGLGRLMACMMEAHHDAHGLIWPPAVAPCDVYLISLGREGTEEAAAAEALYQDLQRTGLRVLYDDRPERAGVKFNDADLLGIPIRLTMSARTWATQSVECKLRWEKEPRSLPLTPKEDLVAYLRAILTSRGAEGLS